MNDYGYVYRRLTSADEQLFSQLTPDDLSFVSLARREVPELRGFTLAHVVAWNNKKGHFGKIARHVQERILDLQDNGGNTVLHIACQQGSILGVIPDLLTDDRLEMKNREGHTPFDTHHSVAFDSGQRRTLVSYLERKASIQGNICEILRRKMR